MNPKTLCRRAVSCLSLSRLVSTPLILTMPDVGVSMHPIMLRMVDLPEPEGPVIEMNSPFSIVKETPRTACTSVFPRGYTLVTSTSSTTISWSFTMSPPAFIQQRRITKLKIWTSCLNPPGPSVGKRPKPSSADFLVTDDGPVFRPPARCRPPQLDNSQWSSILQPGAVNVNLGS